MFCGGERIQKVSVEGLVVTNRSTRSGGNGIGKTKNRDHGWKHWVAVYFSQFRYAGTVAVCGHSDL